MVIDKESASDREKMAMFGHGALTAMHLFSAAWHLTDPDRDEKNWVYASVHGSMAVFDLFSAKKHFEKSQE